MIVDTAGSPVLETTVVDVVVHRCQPVPDSLEYPTPPDELAEDENRDEEDGEGSRANRFEASSQATSAPDDAPNDDDVLIAADEMWDSMTTREQCLLYATTQRRSARSIEERLGIAKSTANRVQPKLVDNLKRTLPDDDFGHAVVAELARRPQELSGGTDDQGSASDPEVGQAK